MEDGPLGPSMAWGYRFALESAKPLTGVDTYRPV